MKYAEADLEVFLAVAREHRFSRAAEKLYRTQSAVSQTIRKLEEYQWLCYVDDVLLLQAKMMHAMGASYNGLGKY